MIHYGFAAIWDDGVNLGYSTNLMDIATNAAMVNLAGQDETKVGTITNIELFKELFQEDLLLMVDESSDPQDGQIHDLDLIYQKACSLIQSEPDEDFHLVYIEREHTTNCLNGKLCSEFDKESE